MSTDVSELLQTQISDMRKAMDDGFRHINDSIGRRLDEHTTRMNAIVSRQDTYEASHSALQAERLRASDRGWRLWGAVVAVAMLTASIVGIVLR